MAEVFFKLEVNWLASEESEWLHTLTVGARFAWLQAQVYAKACGRGGSVKAPSVIHFAGSNLIPVEDVRSMIAAAIVAGKLVVDDGEWIFTEWSKSQSEDPTNADRQRRHRERKSRDAQAGEDSNGESLCNTVTPLHNTECSAVHESAVHESALSPPTPHDDGGVRPTAHPDQPVEYRVLELFRGLNPKGYPNLAPERDAPRFCDHLRVKNLHPADWRAYALGWARNLKPERDVGSGSGGEPRTFSEAMRMRGIADPYKHALGILNGGGDDE